MSRDGKSHQRERNAATLGEQAVALATADQERSGEQRLAVAREPVALNKRIQETTSGNSRNSSQRRIFARWRCGVDDSVAVQEKAAPHHFADVRRSTNFRSSEARPAFRAANIFAPSSVQKAVASSHNPGKTCDRTMPSGGISWET
jgi:hypothetical protein